MLYLDTNIFLFSINKKSPHFLPCARLLQLAANNQIKITTSVETIQEIIYYYQKVNAITKGRQLIDNLLKIIDFLIPIDEKTIEIYLKLVDKYSHFRKIASRDLIHVAICCQENISNIITYDQDFKKIKEISSQRPENFLENK